MTPKKEKPKAKKKKATLSSEETKRRSAKSYYDMLIPPAEKKKQTQATVLESLEIEDALNIDLYEGEPTIHGGDLPQEYQKTFVTLIPKEPNTIYAYWEINGDDVDVLKSEIGESAEHATYTLRVYDVTFVDFDGNNANYWFDTDDLHMTSRYVNVWSDDAVYIGEIGLRTPEGEFYKLARSNSVHTPRSTMSSRQDLIWKEVEAKNINTDVFINARLLKRSLRGRLKPRTNWQNNTARITLQSENLRSYYSKGVNLLKLLLSQGDNQSKWLLQALSQGDVKLQESIIPEIAKEITSHDKKIGASEEFMVEKKKNTFPFELDMTLTVRGKTEPGADVYLGEKKIDMKEDGTFTLKWDLNDGALPLDFRAYSSQKMMGKTITTSVIRNITKSQDT